MFKSLSNIQIYILNSTMINIELKNRALKDLILEKTWSIVGGLDGINIVRWTAGAEPRQK